MATEDRHFTYSTLRERIVEHVFVGDVLRTLSRNGVTDVEILRPEFAAHGYDVVMSCGPVVRHVQLKTQAAVTPASQVELDLPLVIGTVLRPSTMTLL